GHCLFYDADYFFTAEHWTEIFWPFHNGHFTGFSGLASHGAAVGISCMVIKRLVMFSRKTM
ncbi:MAG: hypothetical protein II161_03830, partial [Erysipelotrichaceae bacterium]|nr:hypothetical protein [Erysipelotrichaceae bacterium]